MYILSLGILALPESHTELYDILFHAFGRDEVDDYVVKGMLLDILTRDDSSPSSGSESELTLYDLLYSPTMMQVFWAHPWMLFWRPEARVVGDGGLGNKIQLAPEYIVRRTPYVVPDDEGIGDIYPDTP
jgi:hypothetical protein